jgi:SRSO17 transposase
MVRVGAALWRQVFDQLAALIVVVFAQTRSHATALDYVRALLPETPRRSCWQLGELAGHLSPRRMQALLGEYVWQADLLVERVRRLVMAHMGDTQAVLAIDETAEIKQGQHTVGVARQYAGVTGQVENCQTVVVLAYVTARAYALVDFLLYLPKCWANDPARREAAGVPEPVAFATKPQLAVALLRRAAAAGMAFAWVAADEVYRATRRLVVSPAQSGGTRREVSGSDGLPGTERIRGQEHARKATVVFRCRSGALRDPRDMAKAGLPEP